MFFSDKMSDSSVNNEKRLSPAIKYWISKLHENDVKALFMEIVEISHSDNEEGKNRLLNIVDALTSEHLLKNSHKFLNEAIKIMKGNYLIFL